MKKKIIGLCTLLLVLLLGLSTYSYARTGPAIKIDVGNTDKTEIFEILYEHFFAIDINNLNSSQQSDILASKNNWVNDNRLSSFYTNVLFNYTYDFFISANNFAINSPIYSGSGSASNSADQLQMMKSSPPNISRSTFGNFTIVGSDASYFLLQNPNDNNLWYEYSSTGWSISDELGPSFNFIPDSSQTIYLPNDGGNKNIAYCINPILGPGVTGYVTLGYVEDYILYNKLGVYCIWYYNISGDIMLGRSISSSYYALRDGTLMFNQNNLYKNTVYQFFFTEKDQEGNNIPLGSVYFYVGFPSSSPTFRSGDFSWSDPQVIVEAIVGSSGSGDSPGIGILGGISSFFNGLYEKLFKLDDNSIQDIYDNSVDLLPSGDSPVDFYNTILDAAQSSSGDFVISWPDINFDMLVAGQHISTKFISGDSINFNAIIRADNRISDMWHTFQIILVFTVYYLLFVGWYDCILKLLGVSDGLITEDSDDITTVGTVESVSSSIDMSTGEIKQSNKIRKTNYRRTVSRK